MINVNIIGSGNTATNFAHIFNTQKSKIGKIYSRNSLTGKQLANDVNAQFLNEINQDFLTCDVIIIAISDDEIKSILPKLNDTKALVLHTSGSVDISELKNFDNRGVLYPLQTLNKNIIEQKILYCIEANTSNNIDIIKNLISDSALDIKIINSNDRKIIHLIAVNCNNFLYHLLYLNKVYGNDNNIDFKIFKPLVEKTTNLIFNNNEYLQTGPAMRDDISTINKHLNMLQNHLLQKNIYELFTEQIKDLNTKKF